MRANTALMAGERLAAWLAPDGWRDCSQPFSRADAEKIVADFNRRHSRPDHQYTRYEHRAVARGTYFVVQRRPL